MQAIKSSSRARHLKRELLALMLASLACVVVLTVSLVDRPSPNLAGINTQTLLLIVLLAGGGGGVIGLVLVLTLRARRVMRIAREETIELKRNLITAEAIFKAEPQVLIFWEHGDELKVITHTLTSVQGVPADKPGLLTFGNWLDPYSAEDLVAALDELFADGQPFTLFLKTVAGGHLEADGRAAGARAVLRLRDVAGAKQDLVRILDQHRRLTREIRISRALLDTLPISVWLKDGDGTIKWANRSYANAVEAEGIDDVYDRQLELMETRQRAALEASLRKSHSFSKRLHLVVDGDRKPHDVFAVESDDVVAAAAIDVGELETAQGELDRQIEAFDRTLDRVATPVAIFGRDQKLTFFNEAYQSLWKLDPDWLDQGPSDGEVLDRLKELSQLPPMAEYRKWKKSLLDCYRSDTEYDEMWPLPDGRTLHVVGAQRPDGGVTYIYDDVSERLAHESRYDALIRVQRSTIDSLQEGVAVFATDGRLRLFNSGFLAIWQLSRSAMEKEPHFNKFVERASILAPDKTAWTKLAETVTTISYQRESVSGHMNRPDKRIIDYATTPLPDGSTLVTFADVTSSRSYERALLERNEALEAADQLKSQFIGHVSYELRTPLTNIMGFNELMMSARTGPLNAKQLEYLGDISTSSRTLLAIVDDILELAIIDAGTLELKPENVQIRPLIESAIEGVKERAGQARLTLEIALDDEAERFVADADRVQQVLFKLLSNAVGFSKPGGTVRLSCWRKNREVVFAIEDEGVGIPKDQQSKIFDRFESNSLGSHHRGAGLGLSIVKSLVELHGGQMALVSELGHGTTVTVRFPEGGNQQKLSDEVRESSLRA